MGFKNACTAAGSVALGALSDRVGRAPVLAVSSLAELAWVGYLCLATIRKGGQRFGMVFGLAAVLGVASGGSNTSTTAVTQVPVLWPQYMMSWPPSW